MFYLFLKMSYAVKSWIRYRIHPTYETQHEV